MWKALNKDIEYSNNNREEQWKVTVTQNCTAIIYGQENYEICCNLSEMLFFFFMYIVHMLFVPCFGF